MHFDNYFRVPKFNIISVDTPTIEPSNKITLLDHGNAVTLTCKTDYDNMDFASYAWKIDSLLMYVYFGLRNKT